MDALMLLKLPAVLTVLTGGTGSDSSLREELTHTREGTHLRKGCTVQLQRMRPVIANSSFPFLPSFSPLVTEEG